MASGDNIGINPGAGATVTADAVTRAGDAGISFAQMVKILDGTDGSINALLVGTDGAARVKDIGVSTSVKNYSFNADTTNWTIVQQGGSNLSGRTTVVIQNDSDVDFEFSFTGSGATPALGSGMKIRSGQTMEIGLADTVNCYVRALSGSGKRVNVIEAN